MTDTTYASLRDRAVLISGGATGIGASIVSHFAATYDLYYRPKNWEYNKVC